MISSTLLSSRWVDCLESQERPTPSDLREHLLEMHRHHRGFTEACASRSRDASGRNSYEWLQREFPRYGAIDLGDPRVRKPAALGDLINEFFRED